MRPRSLRALVLLLLAAALAPSVAPAVVLGGGAPDKDCRVAFEGVDATAGASGVVCTDGDPACDLDGVADGVCRVDVSACVGVALQGCGSVTLDRMVGGGAAIAPPALPASDGTCGVPSGFAVATDTVVAATLRAYLGNELREVDYLNLCCVSAPGPFDAAACAVAIDPSASGCASVPARALRKLEQARAHVAQAKADPAVARKALRKAARLAAKVRGVGRKIARRDDCGLALGLMATHAQDVLLDAVP